MISTIESLRSHHLVPRRTSRARQMGRGTAHPASIGSARPDYLQSCVSGLFSKDIARALRISRPTVQLWRQRFLALRLLGLEKDAHVRERRIPDFSPQRSKPSSTPPCTRRRPTPPTGAREVWPRPGAEQRHHSPNLEAAPSETQTRVETFKLSRDKRFIEKTPRRGRALSESARQSPSALRRRESQSRPSTALSRSCR